MNLDRLYGPKMERPYIRGQEMGLRTRSLKLDVDTLIEVEDLVKMLVPDARTRFFVRSGNYAAKTFEVDHVRLRELSPKGDRKRVSFSAECPTEGEQVNRGSLGVIYCNDTMPEISASGIFTREIADKVAWKLLEDGKPRVHWARLFGVWRGQSWPGHHINYFSRRDSAMRRVAGRWSLITGIITAVVSITGTAFVANLITAGR